MDRDDVKNKIMKEDSIVIKVHAVHQGEGERDNGTPQWFFTDKSKAIKVSKNRGWWGGTAPVSTQYLVRAVNGELYHVKNPEPVRLDPEINDKIAKQERALSKLTDEDKEVLGLTEML